MENAASPEKSLLRKDGLRRIWLLFAVRYLIIFTPLSLIWEFAHMPLYTIWRSGTVKQIILYGLHCTGGDILIATGALAGAAILFGRLNWPKKRSAIVFTSLLLFGLGYTIYSEWLNTVVRKSWEYSAQMPVLPPFGTGLSPALQWVIIPAISYILAHKYIQHLGIRGSQ